MKLEIKTSDGTFVAHYSANGLARLKFPEDVREEEINVTEPGAADAKKWHALTTKALKTGLAGKDFGELPPVDLGVGTDFQRDVWGAMQRIKTGATKSYAEIASSIKNLKAVRAVGGACGANPIPVFIPCHRVLAANRKIGGFSSGLPWKHKLLAREGVTLI